MKYTAAYKLMGAQSQSKSTCWIQLIHNRRFFFVLAVYTLPLFYCVLFILALLIIAISFDYDSSNIVLSSIAYQFSSMLNHSYFNQITRPLASFFSHLFLHPAVFFPFFLFSVLCFIVTSSHRYRFFLFRPIQFDIEIIYWSARVYYCLAALYPYHA